MRLPAAPACSNTHTSRSDAARHTLDGSAGVRLEREPLAGRQARRVNAAKAGNDRSPRAPFRSDEPEPAPCKHSPMNTSWSGKRDSFPAAMRKAILRRHPTCQCSGCNHCGTGCDQRSTIADHITNWAQCQRRGIPPHTLSNGQGMCSPCHDRKTWLEQRAGRQLSSRHRPQEEHPNT